jgi:head-tail adaptor
MSDWSDLYAHTADVQRDAGADARPTPGDPIGRGRDNYVTVASAVPGLFQSAAPEDAVVSGSELVSATHKFYCDYDADLAKIGPAHRLAGGNYLGPSRYAQVIGVVDQAGRGEVLAILVTVKGRDRA